MQKYKINTYGCQMNVHESEKIAGILSELGYVETNDDAEANIIVFNTCCIRDNAERRIEGNIGALKPMKLERKGDMLIAVVGCMTQQEGSAKALKSKFPFIDIILGANNLQDLKPAILNLKKSYINVPQIEKPEIREDIPILRTGYPNAWINIMYGCNNFCTYCIVPYVRGRERSRKKSDIIDDVKRVLDEGYKEITLLGQNVDSYGSDLESGRFSDILSEIAKMEGKFRLRFMTSHPKDFNSEVIDIIASCDNICNNIHLPVQSGSSKVLRDMNRRYDREKYLNIISDIRSKIPDCGITSDIMVGFPTETDEDFQDTVSLVEQVRYSNAFTFVYSPRKGTPAARMVQLPEEVKKARITKLVDLQNKISKEISDEYIGKVKEILVEDVNPRYDSSVCGRTSCGRLVTVKGDPSMIGKFYDVEITSSRSASLFGEIRGTK